MNLFQGKVGKAAAMEMRINTPLFVWQPDVVMGLYLLSQIQLKRAEEFLYFFQCYSWADFSISEYTKPSTHEGL